MDAATHGKWSNDLTRFLAVRNSAGIGQFLREWTRQALNDDADDLILLGLRTAGLILRAREKTP